MRSEVTWPTIPAMVRDAARRHGDAEAVVDGTRRVGFASLAEMVARRGAGAARVGDRARRPGRGVGAELPRMDRRRARRDDRRRRARPGQHPLPGAEAAYVLARSGARVLFTVRGFLDTDYPALLAGAGVDAPGARAHDPARRRRRDGDDAIAWDDVPRPRRRGARRRRSTRASRRSAPTTRATSCSRRARPATRRAS